MILLLKLRSPVPDGWARAKCRDFDISNDDPFFSDDEIDQEEAASYCNGDVDRKPCPIRDKCLLFALSNNIDYGVFGGMTQLGRKGMKKKLPPHKGKPNSDWRHMTQDEALSNLSEREIAELKRSFLDRD